MTSSEIYRLETTIKLRKAKLDKYLEEAVRIEDEINRMQKELEELRMR